MVSPVAPTTPGSSPAIPTYPVLNLGCIELYSHRLIEEITKTEFPTRNNIDEVFRRCDFKLALLKEPLLTADQKVNITVRILENETSSLESERTRMDQAQEEADRARTQLGEGIHLENLFERAEACYVASSALHRAATLAMMAKNRRLAKSILKAGKGIKAAGTIMGSLEKLQSLGKTSTRAGVGFSVGDVESIVGACYSIIGLWGEEQDIAGERHRQMLDTLHEIHKSILESLGEHQASMMQCFEQLDRTVGILLTRQQRIILNGFNKMLFEQPKTRSVLARQHMFVMNRLGRLKYRQSSHESLVTYLMHIEERLPAYVKGKLRTQLTEATTLISSDPEYTALFERLCAIAISGSTQDILTGGDVAPESLDLVGSALGSNDVFGRINLIKSLLRIEGDALPNTAVWTAAVNILVIALKHRLDEKKPLDKEHHLQRLSQVWHQGHNLTRFLTHLSQPILIGELVENYVIKMRAMQEALNSMRQQFDQEAMQKAHTLTRNRAVNEKETIESSYRFDFSRRRLSPKFFDLTVARQEEMKGQLLSFIPKFNKMHRSGLGVHYMWEKFGNDFGGLGVRVRHRDHLRMRTIELLLDDSQRMVKGSDGFYRPSGLPNYYAQFHSIYKTRKGNKATNALCAMIFLQKRHENLSEDSPNQEFEINLVKRWLTRYYAPLQVIRSESLGEDNIEKTAFRKRVQLDALTRAGKRRNVLGDVIANIKPGERVTHAGGAPTVCSFELLNRAFANGKNERTMLVYGDGIPLDLRRATLLPPKTSDVVMKRWKLAMIAESIGAGEIHHTYVAKSQNDFTIQTELRTLSSSIVVAKWVIPNWQEMVATCYSHSERLFFFWYGGNYQKPFNPSALPVSLASTNSGYGSHPPVDLSLMQEVECPDTESALLEEVQVKVHERQQLFKKRLIEEFRTFGSSLFQSKQELNIAFRLLRSILILSFPEECSRDEDLVHFLAGEGFLEEGNVAASALFEWDGETPFLYATLDDSIQVITSMTNKLISKIREKDLVPGNSQLIEAMNALFTLIERLKNTATVLEPRLSELIEQMAALTQLVVSQRLATMPVDGGGAGAGSAGAGPA